MKLTMLFTISTLAFALGNAAIAEPARDGATANAALEFSMQRGLRLITDWPTHEGAENRMGGESILNQAVAQLCTLPKPQATEIAGHVFPDGSVLFSSTDANPHLAVNAIVGRAFPVGVGIDCGALTKLTLDYPSDEVILGRRIGA